MYYFSYTNQFYRNESHFSTNSTIYGSCTVKLLGNCAATIFHCTIFPFFAHCVTNYVPSYIVSVIIEMTF